jgi:hypothetical protein
MYPMSRPLRIQLAGGVYDVTSRGDGRDDIYLSDDDRDAWLVAGGFRAGLRALSLGLSCVGNVIDFYVRSEILVSTR